MHISRAFDAPRPLVWRFFMEPALLAQWFGPASVTVDPESVVIDPRTDGRWHLDMVDAASGDRFPLRATLTSVIEPEYLEGRIDGEQFGPEGGVTLRIWFHDHG
ncbi:SRPBCC domain-containing protein, partial [Schumannella luteola]